MLVSIIIPAYNAEKTIKRAIDSVIAQTYPDWECLVVDDGSEDATLFKVGLSGMKIRNELIYIHHQRRVGVSAARNTALSEAKGDAVFFLDADDWMEPDCLEHLVGIGIGRSFTPPIIEWPDGGETEWVVKPSGMHFADSPFLFADTSCDIGHVTGSLYSKDVIPPECFYFQDVPIYEDMLFNMGIIFAGRGVFISKKHLYHYCRHADSITYGNLSVEDARKVLDAFDWLVLKHNPPEEVSGRFKAFLLKSLQGRLGERFAQL